MRVISEAPRAPANLLQTSLRSHPLAFPRLAQLGCPQGLRRRRILARRWPIFCCSGSRGGVARCIDFFLVSSGTYFACSSSCRAFAFRGCPRMFFVAVLGHAFVPALAGKAEGPRGYVNNVDVSSRGRRLRSHFVAHGAPQCHVYVLFRWAGCRGFQLGHAAAPRGDTGHLFFAAFSIA